METRSSHSTSDLDLSSNSHTSSFDDSDHPTRRNRRADLTASFILSWFLGIFLIGSLIYFGGPWHVAANTRVLDPLINGGLIRYHDLNIGPIQGLPDLYLYLQSQDPVDWKFVWMAVGIYVLYWVIMSYHFHGIAQFCGLKGSLGRHARAFIYGDWFNRVFPFWLGHVATASALEGQGESPSRTRHVVYIQDVFVLFATIVLGIIGLVLSGWEVWIKTIIWPLIICVVFYLVLGGRVRLRGAALAEEGGSWKTAVRHFQALCNQPMLLWKLSLLAMLSVCCDDFCPYFLSRAFTSEHVLLNISFLTIQNGVVAGYIARLIPLTLGGVGQYEWGFASALYLSGVGFPEAATLALLDSAARNLTYGFIFGGMSLRGGAGTNLRTVLQLFTRTRDEAPNDSLPEGALEPSRA